VRAGSGSFPLFPFSHNASKDTPSGSVIAFPAPRKASGSRIERTGISGEEDLSSRRGEVITSSPVLRFLTALLLRRKIGAAITLALM